MNLSVLLLEIIFVTFGGAWENLWGRTDPSSLGLEVCRV